MGIVENPQSLLDEFALVAARASRQPDGRHRVVRPARCSAELIQGRQGPDPSVGRPVECRSTPRRSLWSHSSSACCSSHSSRSVGLPCWRNAECAPSACSRRRGATDRHVRLVVSANGTVVGVVGAILGFILGTRPLACLSPESRAELAPRHRRCSPCHGSWSPRRWCLRSWRRISRLPDRRGPSQGADSAGACRADRRRPVRSIAQRSPASSFSFSLSCLLGYSGGTNNGNGSGGAPELLLGIVLLIPGLILLAPFFLSLDGGVGRWSADRSPTGSARSRPLPSAVGFGSGGNQSRLC